MKNENKTAQELALKPCPFCGCEATIDIEADDEGYEHGGEWCSISIGSCKHTNDCPFKHQSFMGFEFDGDDFTPDQAVKMWNTRALAPPSDNVVSEALGYFEAMIRACEFTHIEHNKTIRQALQSLAGQEGDALRFAQDDLKHSQSHCRSQQEEISTLKREIATLNLDRVRKEKASRADAVDVDVLAKELNVVAVKLPYSIRHHTPFSFYKALAKHVIDQGCLTQKPDDGMVFVPRELTAENGMKGLLSGEFYELIDQADEDGEEIEPQKVYVSWDNIKKIHRAVVAQHLTED